ncbi:ABC transporter permease [Butyrivibrio sp. AE3004]|uniref:ABC transporter permease n=1 Tax=Butyrivibrio sp. AE3004 TaxID=1506994 RepID=UPI00049475B7|nr:ABC transporter permease [Butyrivibrio sp. AE3004]
MIKKAIKKIVGLALILVILSFFVFALLYLSPGDPAEKRLTSQGVAVTKEVLDAERQRLGLLKPFLVRYGEWLVCVIRGDFGVSFKDDMPVAPKLFTGLKNTTILASASLLLSLAVSFLFSIVSALRKNKISDNVIKLLSFIGNSLPNFLISVLLMYFLCIKIKVFPVIAAGDLKGLFMPVLSLSIPMTGRFIRQMRAEFLEQLKEDYVIGMKGRGVKKRYIVFNVLRNSLGHIFTIIALQIGTLMGGSVVIETIFRWPGIGKLVMDSITARDYPVIMGFVVIMGTIYVLINQLSDIIGRMLDPRTNI